MTVTEHVTLIFVLLAIGSVALEFWLSRRNAAHVIAHRDHIPTELSSAISPEAHYKAADYTIARSRFGRLQMLVSLALLLAWTVGGGLQLLNSLVSPLATAWGPLGYQLALLFCFSLIGGLIQLPFEAYEHFRLEERFGFNRMTPKIWVLDLAKNFFISALIGLPLAALMLWLMGAAGSNWWLWAWAVWVGFNMLLMVVYPIWIAPLFNKFEPLSDATLKTRVEALMRRCGFKAQGLFVMDGSTRSAESNAYFTGLGNGKRVVLYDTLIASLNHDELEAVLAHELGHFHHRHLQRSLVMMFLFSLLGFGVLGALTQWTPFFVGLGVIPNDSLPNDAMALLLFLLAIPIVGPFISPLANHRSRQHEFEADAYARRQASGEALISALLKLTRDNAMTLTPEPLYVRFNYSHPPTIERIAALRSG
jgi:STE24 endopeptidase